MGPYIVVFSSVFLINLFYGISFRFDKLILTISLLLLGFLYSFRFISIGDYHTYELIFDNINDIESVLPSHYLEMEPGYLYINRLLSSFGFNFQIVVIAQTFFLFFTFYKLIVKYSKNFFVSVMILILLINIYNGIVSTIIRQSFSLCFVLLSIPYIIERKFIKFFVCVLIGSLFHINTVIVFPLYFITVRHYSKGFYKKMMLGTILFYFLNVFSNIIYKVISIIPHFKGYLQANYLKFFEPKDFISSLLVFSLIYLFKLVFEAREGVVKSSQELFFINFSFFSSVISVVMLSSTIFSRVMYFLFFSYVISFSYLLVIYTNIKSKKILYAYIALLSIVTSLIIQKMTGEVKGTVPYKSRYEIFK